MRLRNKRFTSNIIIHLKLNSPIHQHVIFKFANQPVVVVVQDIGGLGFDTRARQTGCKAANGWSALRRFFGAM